MRAVALSTPGVKDATYYIPDARDVTIGNVIDFFKEIQVNKPESLLKYEQATTAEEREELAITEEVMHADWLPYIKKVIQYWTKISDEHFDGIPITDPTGKKHDVFGMRSILLTNLSLHTPPEKELTRFQFKRQHYYLPSAKKNPLNGDNQYMSGSKYGEFVAATEARKYFESIAAGNPEGALWLIAMLCRKKKGKKIEPLPSNEEERMEFLEKRVNILKDLPFDRAQTVTFFLLGQATIYRLDSLIRSKVEAT